MKNKLLADIEKIASANLEIYRESFDLFTSFASEVKRIIVDSLPSDIKIHKAESRAKTLDSFKKKCLKQNEDGSPKYKNPYEQITDLAGVRIIVFVPDTIIDICNEIENYFDVIEKRDLGEDRFDEGKFGYKSIHYLVRLTKSRTSLPDYKKYDGMICEIQIRTILQHAWAELEHDIQYKTQTGTPKNIARRFIALAGMIEIADREFQAIQDEDAKIRSELKHSLEEEMTKSVIEQIDSPQKQSASNPKSARELMQIGDYKGAIELYTRWLEKSPGSYTHYLGRAKAYFLDGRRDKALEDLQFANSLHPNNPATSALLLAIEEGVVRKPNQDTANASKFLEMGKNALEKGNAEEAFEYFSESQNLGYTRIFSTFNKAMACLLANDLAGAKNFLKALSKIPGTPMEINIIFMEILIDKMDGINPSDKIEVLNEIIKRKGDFGYQQSPLKFLERGFINKGGAPDELLNLFELIK